MAKQVGERGRRRGDLGVVSVFSHEDSLWLSKFTWPGRLERHDIDWMQINVSKCRKSLQLFHYKVWLDPKC